MMYSQLALSLWLSRVVLSWKDCCDAVATVIPSGTIARATEPHPHLNVPGARRPQSASLMEPHLGLVLHPLLTPVHPS